MCLAHAYANVHLQSFTQGICDIIRCAMLDCAVVVAWQTNDAWGHSLIALGLCIGHFLPCLCYIHHYANSWAGPVHATFITSPVVLAMLKALANLQRNLPSHILPCKVVHMAAVGRHDPGKACSWKNTTHGWASLAMTNARLPLLTTYSDQPGW